MKNTELEMLTAMSVNKENDIDLTEKVRSHRRIYDGIYKLLNATIGQVGQVNFKDNRYTGAVELIVPGGKLTVNFKHEHLTELPYRTALSIICAMLTAKGRRVPSKVRSAIVATINHLTMNVPEKDIHKCLRNYISIGGNAYVGVEKGTSLDIFSKIQVNENVLAGPTLSIEEFLDFSSDFAHGIDDDRHRMDILACVSLLMRDIKDAKARGLLPVESLEQHVDTYPPKSRKLFLGLIGRFTDVYNEYVRFPTGYRLYRYDQDNKGKENGSCNVNACQSPIDVTHYNHGTSAYYCKGCADEIDDANYRNDLFERRGKHNFD